MDNRVIRAAMLVALLGSGAGCSTLNVGKEEYACPGMPNGVVCHSASEVYEMTNNGNVPLPMRRDESSETEAAHPAEMDVGEEEGTEPRPAVNSTAKSEASNRTIYSPSPETAQVAREYIAPNLGRYPIPIRTPAKVMRIWIAPFEDQTGDLVMPGFVYTEIEPRRWVIGEEGRGVGKGKHTSRPLKAK